MTRKPSTPPNGFFPPRRTGKAVGQRPCRFAPVLAIAGLAGLRGEEIMRLDWADVWRVAGHIEITARQAKTRQRRLVEICPALAAWLESYRKTTGKVYPAGVHVIPARICGTARQPGNTSAAQRTAPRLLHLSFRPELQRKFDRRASGQLSRDDSRALQRSGDETRSGKMVQRVATGRGKERHLAAKS